MIYSCLYYIVDNCIQRIKGWSWMYSSWIYNYLCNLPITTNVVSSNPAQARCTRYNTDSLSDLQKVSDFLRVLWFPQPIKLDDITEILLKVVLNTIILLLQRIKKKLRTTYLLCIDIIVFLLYCSGQFWSKPELNINMLWFMKFVSLYSTNEYL
jgi:hypothetical protein